MYRIRRRRSTINLLITHLAVADLFVSFFCNVTDAVWTATVQWYAGDVMCKTIKFLQVFGLYLSTYVIVIISIDRCLAILDPISRNKAPARVRTMLTFAWVLSFMFSLPQVSRSPSFAPYSRSPSFAPHSRSPSFAPHSRSPSFAPYSRSPSFAPHNRSPSFAPQSRSPSFATSQQVSIICTSPYSRSPSFATSQQVSIICNTPVNSFISGINHYERSPYIAPTII